MRKFLIVIAATAFGAAALSTTATAQQPGQTGVQGAEGGQQQRSRVRDANSGERRICVTEQLANSRLRRRVCHTQAEWDLLHPNDDR